MRREERRDNKIFIRLKNFNSLNQEMKMRVFEKSIKDFTNSYYSPRSKKIFNLIDQIRAKKNAKLIINIKKIIVMHFVNQIQLVLMLLCQKILAGTY